MRRLERTVDHPYPWLKYVDADELDDQVGVDSEHVIESATGERLGDVDGFIVDSESGRPYYVVVDAGGWFKSKDFLLPVGRVNLDAERAVLTTNLTRERVERFPGFDRSEFDKFGPDELGRFNRETLQACTIPGSGFSLSEAEPFFAAWDYPDFQYPQWWRRGEGGPERARAAAISSNSPLRASEDRQRVGREAHDPSPHFGGRAQPGDVIGIETEGERSYVGDTAEDENRRREDAEQALRSAQD
jgi:hypothetical protein